MANVFLGMPGYGNQTAEAGRGFWRASQKHDVKNAYRNGSLLAANFNALWCDALNLVHEGHKVDYFAMLHDDIGPDDYWLDTLIDELESNKLDVLGVAVPIKDTRGVTSLAVDSGNNWRPACRLTMHEVYELPEVFTSKDIGAPLLLNTGCWVCKFDPSWVTKIHFTINDRIVFDQSQNKGKGGYIAEVEPEDWFVSRLFHELKLNIGATRKIGVDHRGSMVFGNARPWGSSKFDKEYRDRSILPAPFPYEVPGWLDPSEGNALRKLSEGKRVLEIGSYCGRSTICIAQTASKVVAVDYFDGRATPEQRDTSETFNKSLKKYGVYDKVTTCHPEAELPPGKFGFVFIDGDHSYEAVRRDIDRAASVLTEDGLIAFHDYRLEPDEKGCMDWGVTKAVNELLGMGAELLQHTSTLAVVRLPAAVTSGV